MKKLMDWAEVLTTASPDGQLPVVFFPARFDRFLTDFRLPVFRAASQLHMVYEMPKAEQHCC